MFSTHFFSHLIKYFPSNMPSSVYKTCVYVAKVYNFMLLHKFFTYQFTPIALSFFSHLDKASFISYCLSISCNRSPTQSSSSIYFLLPHQQSACQPHLLLPTAFFPLLIPPPSLPSVAHLFSFDPESSPHPYFSPPHSYNPHIAPPSVFPQTIIYFYIFLSTFSSSASPLPHYHYLPPPISWATPATYQYR